MSQLATIPFSDPVPPVVLTIAGSDCSGGAGIQADLKTFQAHHLHGLSVVTAIVSETAEIVRGIHPVPIEMVIDQLELMLRAFPIAAIKTGMLVSTECIEAVAALIAKHAVGIPLVVDPVMVASTGARLLPDSAVRAYRQLLLPLATVLTPNLPETEVFTDRKIRDLSALEAAGQQLAAASGCAVMAKGGHLDGPDCVDLLCTRSGAIPFSSPRQAGRASHGTGCTFAAAIAAGLALGDSLETASLRAKNFLNAALAGSYRFTPPTPQMPAILALDQGTRELPTNPGPN